MAYINGKKVLFSPKIQISANGTGKDAIIPVDTLPTYNISTKYFYSTQDGLFWYDGIWHQVIDDGITVETDPTVPNWAKQPNKPTYTAEEVGALPSSTVIPAIPTKISAFENDEKYLKELKYIDLLDKPFGETGLEEATFTATKYVVLPSSGSDYSRIGLAMGEVILLNDIGNYEAVVETSDYVDGSYVTKSITSSLSDFTVDDTPNWGYKLNLTTVDPYASIYIISDYKAFISEYLVTLSSNGVYLADFSHDMQTPDGIQYSKSSNVKSLRRLSVKKLSAKYIDISGTPEYKELADDTASALEGLSALEAKVTNPDYNENEVTSPAYIKNRPFYLKGTPPATYTVDDYNISLITGYGWTDAGLASTEIPPLDVFGYSGYFEVETSASGTTSINEYHFTTLTPELVEADGVLVGRKHYMNINYTQVAVYFIYNYASYNESQGTTFPSNGIYLQKGFSDIIDGNSTITYSATITRLWHGVSEDYDIKLLDNRFIDLQTHPTFKALKEKVDAGGSGGSSEAIIDVIALPTENINEDVFYRLLTGSLVFNQYVQNAYTVHCVETLPEVGEPATNVTQTQGHIYYSVQGGNAYGYVDDILSSAFSVPKGWYTADVLINALGLEYKGIITDILDDPRDDALRLLLEYVIWQYKDGKWNSLKPIGWEGDGRSAEVFNHPSNKAYGVVSHAEGRGTVAGVEGEDTYGQHAEGFGTRALGEAAHSEGRGTEALEDYSHSEGDGTIAGSEAQHVQGRYNIEDTGNMYAHIVGNGMDDNHRSNAHTLTWGGHAWYPGGVYVGGSSILDENAEKLAKPSELNTVDKITAVNFDSGNKENVEVNEYGIRWCSDETEIEMDVAYNSLHYFNNAIFSIPLVAGDGVTFELDEENQVVRVNATGSSSKLYFHNIHLYIEEDVDTKYADMYFAFYSSSATPITTYDQLFAIKDRLTLFTSVNGGKNRLRLDPEDTGGDEFSYVINEIVMRSNGMTISGSSVSLTGGSSFNIANCVIDITDTVSEV